MSMVELFVWVIKGAHDIGKFALEILTQNWSFSQARICVYVPLTQNFHSEISYHQV